MLPSPLPQIASDSLSRHSFIRWEHSETQGTLFLPMGSRLLRTALGNNGPRHEVPFLEENLKMRKFTG